MPVRSLILDTYQKLDKLFFSLQANEQQPASGTATGRCLPGEIPGCVRRRQVQGSCIPPAGSNEVRVTCCVRMLQGVSFWTVTDVTAPGEGVDRSTVSPGTQDTARLLTLVLLGADRPHGCVLIPRPRRREGTSHGAKVGAATGQGCERCRRVPTACAWRATRSHRCR
jgi:hypothetical protein